MDPEQVARTNGATSKLSEEDAFYVSRCEELRQTSTHKGLIPGQSNFLVAALITYSEQESAESANKDEESKAKQAKKYVYGLNAEPCSIGGSICAERSCIVQLQMIPVAKIHSIYITTSTELEVTPGPLCREWLSEICAPDTPIVLFTRTSCTSIPIQELYPYQNLYSGMVASEAARVARLLGPAAVSFLKEQQVREILTDDCKHLAKSVVSAYENACKLANEFEQGDDYHPLQYAAAVVFEKGEVEVAKQSTCVEYGCTIDAFSKLVKDIEKHSKNDSSPVVVLQVDQFGICQPPPAKTRSYLVEFGNQHALALFHYPHEGAQSGTSRLLWESTRSDTLGCITRSFESLLPTLCEIPFSNAAQ
eukprot:gb/GECG01000835.1/.p1 GENE.gb/GECG01000835.1/~~gb/GECG01000835.1/.p1  ORF type:complete len:364 (+),score=40.70 gb/GECG01000835.1/:1-1092(+)